MDKILVVTPTLNRPALCRRAVASLLAQDFRDWTLVIAKNGGTDLVDAYESHLAPYLSDPRVRLLVLPGKGIGYALNQAIREFQNDHEYFAILEDDDEWAPTFLHRMKGAVDQSGAEIALCKCRQLPEAKGGWGPGGPMRPGLILMGSWIAFPQCLFRMRVHRSVGDFAEDSGAATDWDWQIRCAAAELKHTFVDETLMTHHWHGDNYCQREGKPAHRRIIDWMCNGRYENMPRLLEAQLIEAAGFRAAGNYQLAEALYSRVLEIEPGNAEVWALSGQLAVQTGDRQIATERLEIAITLGASTAGALYQIAGLYTALGDHASAYAMIEKTLSVEPGHVLAQRALRSRQV